MYNGDDVLLSLTRDVVDRRREYFKDLLNSPYMSSSKEAGPWVLEMACIMSGAEVAEVVKNPLVSGPQE